jgi:2,4-dienoyl-CoA reductase-like NADH-dependent reductase (Old Yellow Enzyme family)
MKFDKLLEPFHIVIIKTRNRVIKTAAGTGFLSRDSLQPSKQATAFYEAIARGEAGSLIVEYPSLRHILITIMKSLYLFWQ